MQQIAKEIRKLTVECIASLGQGHIGGSLSIVDVLTVLYFKQMNVDVNNPKMEGRDRLVVSKGHAGPAVYATLCRKGYISHDELLTLNKFGTNLPSHCDMNKTPGVDMTTGSLGQGISCAVGMALASKMSNDNATIYCIIGDGESQEGQIWEASMYASQKKLNNFILFLLYKEEVKDENLKQALEEPSSLENIFESVINENNVPEIEDVKKEVIEPVVEPTEEVKPLFSENNKDSVEFEEVKEDKDTLKELLTSLEINLSNENIEKLRNDYNEELITKNIEILKNHNIDLSVLNENVEILNDTELNEKLEKLISVGKESRDISLMPSVLVKYDLKGLNNTISVLQISGLDPKKVPLMAY